MKKFIGLPFRIKLKEINEILTKKGPFDKNHSNDTSLEIFQKNTLVQKYINARKLSVNNLPQKCIFILFL